MFPAAGCIWRESIGEKRNRKFWKVTFLNVTIRKALNCIFISFSGVKNRLEGSQSPCSTALQCYVLHEFKGFMEHRCVLPQR